MFLLWQGPHEEGVELSWSRDTGRGEPGVVRDPKRIAPLLEQLRELWMVNPDIRLGQLLEIIKPPGQQVFHVEDEVWLKQIDLWSWDAP